MKTAESNTSQTESRAAANVEQSAGEPMVMGDWGIVGNGEVTNNSDEPVTVWSNDDGIYTIPAHSSSATWGEDVDHIQDANGQWWKIGWNTAVVDANGNVSGAKCTSNGPGKDCSPILGDFPIIDDNNVQAKLTTNQPNDRFEQEADAVAERVVSGESQIQRKCAACEEEEKAQMKPLIQLKVNSDRSGQQVGPWIQQQIDSSRGGGQPLRDETRNFMESGIGADFGGVRVHTDSKAVQMNRELGARAFTVGNDIYFNNGEYFPETGEGKRLLAHELTHTVQQGAATESVQRDLALEPQGNDPLRNQSQLDITRAISFNQRSFSDPYSFKTIRDVIGINQYPAVSDSDLAHGVVSWQASQGIAQDGKLGEVTMMFVLEELEAEGQQRDADLLRADYRRSLGSVSDVDTSFCGCQNELQGDIAESQTFIQVYQQCGNDPALTTGDQIENCVDQHFAAQGVSLVTAGSTSSSGNIQVAAQPGPCGPLRERATLAHEQIHGVHTGELAQQHGRGSGAFNAAFNDAQDWVEDEVNSRESDIATARFMINALDRMCISP